MNTETDRLLAELAAMRADLSTCEEHLDALMQAARFVTGCDDDDPDRLAELLLGTIEDLRAREIAVVDAEVETAVRKDLAAALLTIEEAARPHLLPDESIAELIGRLARHGADLALQASDIAKSASSFSDVALAEIKRLRNRAPVVDGDPELGAYTIERGHALCRALGLTRIRETHTYETEQTGYRVKLNHGAARAVNDLASALRISARDVLDMLAEVTP